MISLLNVLPVYGRVAIRRFVDAYHTDKRATLGPNWVKVLARNEPRFLPEAATTSAPVSLAFLRMQNLPDIRCRYHQNERHFERQMPDTMQLLQGCAFVPPKTGEKKPKGMGKGTKVLEAVLSRRKEGHLDCGCSMMDALEEWFHWKTARLRSSNPRINAVFPVHSIIRPLERASMLHALHSPIYIPLRLRYTGVNGWPDLAGQWAGPSYHLDLLKRANGWIFSEIQRLSSEDESVAGKRVRESAESSGAHHQSKKLKAQ